MLFHPRRRIVLLDGMVKKRADIPSAELKRLRKIQETIDEKEKKQAHSRRTRFDAQLRTDDDLNRQVEETLQAMRIEQDLVALREARGVSQAQLAKTLGVSQPAVAKLEFRKNKKCRAPHPRACCRFFWRNGGN